MHKYIFLGLLILISQKSSAQTSNSIDNLSQQLRTLRVENIKINKNFEKLNFSVSDSRRRIDSLIIEFRNQEIANTKIINSLEKQIKEANSQNQNKIAEVNKSLSSNFLYVFIGILSAVLLSALIYWLLSKRRSTDKVEFDGKLETKTTSIKSDIVSEIEKTKKELQQENVKLDLKLIEILQNQLKGSKDSVNIDETINIDHSIPLKVADEITRINAYANSLDPGSQDAKALKSSVKRLINTFKASQYEIIDLLGQKYNDGMKVIVVNAIEDNKLQKGEEVISRIIKPLVKYKGEQIQAAQVDISISI